MRVEAYEKNLLHGSTVPDARVRRQATPLPVSSFKTERPTSVSDASAHWKLTNSTFGRIRLTSRGAEAVDVLVVEQLEAHVELPRLGHAWYVASFCPWVPKPSTCCTIARPRRLLDPVDVAHHVGPELVHHEQLLRQVAARARCRRSQPETWLTSLALTEPIVWAGTWCGPIRHSGSSARPTHGLRSAHANLLRLGQERRAAGLQVEHHQRVVAAWRRGRTASRTASG